MVIQTSNPFKPATPRVPIAPRRLRPSLPGPERNSKENKTRCPKCTALLRVNFDEAECLSCGFVDYEYSPPETENEHEHKPSLISTGTRYVLRYIGEFPALIEVVTHVKVYRVRNRAVFGVRCPFCGGTMAQSSLSGKRREMREERYKCSSGHRVSLCPNNKGVLGWK
jgi:hypothetical protein